MPAAVCRALWTLLMKKKVAPALPKTKSLMALEKGDMRAGVFNARCKRRSRAPEQVSRRASAAAAAFLSLWRQGRREFSVSHVTYAPEVWRKTFNP